MLGNEKIELETIPKKSEIVPYLKKIAYHEPLSVDAIDISGYVLASEMWRDYCISVFNKMSTKDVISWRVALLEPGSQGAIVRAQESTVWNGDLNRLNEAIKKRSEEIMRIAMDIDVDCEIRYYSKTPVTRYMRVGNVVFESYYPHDSTGANTPIAILPKGSVLRNRVEKEFEILWASIGT